MEPNPYRSPELEQEESPRKRRFLEGLVRWRRRKEQKEGKKEEEPPREEQETKEDAPRENTLKKVGRAVLRFTGLPSMGERRRASNESAEARAAGERVIPVSRAAIDLVETEKAHAAEAVEDPVVREVEMIPLEIEEEKLVDATEELETVLHEPGLDSAPETEEEPVQSGEAPSPPVATTSYEQPFESPFPTPAASAAPERRRTPEIRKPTEKEKALGAATVALLLVTGVALWSRHKAKQVAKEKTKEVRSMREQAAARERVLQRQEARIATLEHERERQKVSAESADAEIRRLHLKRVVEVATTQTEITRQATESIRATSAAVQPERTPVAAPSVVVPPERHRPAVIRQESTPVVVPEAAHSEMPMAPAAVLSEKAVHSPAFTEKPVLGQHGERTFAPRVETSVTEALSKSRVESKDAPTEQEFADRIERNPGRLNQPVNRAGGAQPQSVGASPLQDLSIHQSPAAYYAKSPPPLPRSHQPPQMRGPSRKWLIAATGVIVAIGLILLLATV